MYGNWGESEEDEKLSHETAVDWGRGIRRGVTIEGSEGLEGVVGRVLNVVCEDVRELGGKKKKRKGITGVELGMGVGEVLA